MPNYKGHLVGGLGFYLIGLYILSFLSPTLPTALEWLLCALAGSLFPDIDTKSKGQKIFYRILAVITVVLIFQQKFKPLLIIASCALIPIIVDHRGLFHMLWFVIGVPLIFAAIMSVSFPAYKDILFVDAFFFIGGAISHLLLDFGLRRTLRMR
jgi:membrane-bound metal-dependent hydrolase YbcI (DUF457 family)